MNLQLKNLLLIQFTATEVEFVVDSLLEIPICSNKF